MSFFYDLNKRLADLATKQDAKQIKEEAKVAAPRSRLAESLNVAEAGYSAKAGRAGKDLGKPGKNFGKIAKSAGERYGSKAAGERVAGAVLNKLRHPKESEMDESAFQAAIGKKKYGDEGMKALQKAGREHAGKEKMDTIRNRYDKYDESMTDEGNAFTGALKTTPKGGKFKVGGKEFTDTSSIEEVNMTPKQKSFAKLAPPTDKITFADKIAGAKKEVDEMLGDVAAEAMKAAIGKGKRVVADEDGVPSSTGGTIHKTARGLRHVAGKNYGALDVSNDDSDMDDDKPKVKGRPKGSRRAIGAKGPGVKSKLLNKPSIKEEGSTPQEQAYNEIIELLKNSATDINPAIRNRLMRLVRTLNVSEPVAEKATSKAQQRFMGMVHAIQKGEKVKGASPELKKTAKGMKKKDAEDFAATKHKGLPEKVKSKKTEEGAKPDFLDVDNDGDKKESMKKASSDKKEKKVDETTVAGSVATAPAVAKSGKGMVFGKGVYESLDSKLEKMITEGMNVTVTMNSDAEGDAQKSITVTATGAEADKLAELLKMAGLESQQEVCPGCGSTDCGCEAEVVDENSPDWPTNTVTGGENDPNLRTYSGGLNKPKSTGQTTIPVIASQLRRTSTMEENVELERSLFKTWKNYKG
jgi:hypothetical protein